MEIKYYPEKIFAFEESLGSERVVIEFEDGDRSVSVTVDKQQFVNMAKQVEELT